MYTYIPTVRRNVLVRLPTYLNPRVNKPRLHCKKFCFCEDLVFWVMIPLIRYKHSIFLEGPAASSFRAIIRKLLFA